MDKLLPLILLIAFPLLGMGQTMISFKDAAPYDEERYADITGSPYFLETFSKGWIIDEEAIRYDPVQINYNGYTRSFEVRQGDQFIALAPDFYRRIELLLAGDQDTITFVKGLHPGFRKTFVQLIYESDRVLLVKHFEVGLNESVKNIPGKTLTVKRFSRRSDWFLITKADQEITKLEGNKKKLLKTLGQDKALSDFLKANKSIDLDTDEGMELLIEQWERMEY
jgi:hypothetical protein